MRSNNFFDQFNAEMDGFAKAAKTGLFLTSQTFTEKMSCQYELHLFCRRCGGG